MPFSIGPQPTPSNAPFPDTLPFTLGYDPALDLLVQVDDPQTREQLEHVYDHGSHPGTPMAEAGLGRAYADDFLRFVQQHVPGLAGRRTLEVGSGRGFLLRQLADLGADVVGVEPGAPGSLGPEAAGLTVIAAPFRRDMFEERFDLIVHYAVLEHVPDPVAFLADQLEMLTPNGQLVFAVPDCRASIAAGDLSMILHEHWSYFTPDSLSRLAAVAGARIDAFEPGEVGGSLYSAWSAAGSSASPTPGDGSVRFAQRADVVRATLRDWLDQAGTGGVYCPGRFVNYHDSVRVPEQRVRFFDDDPALTGRYYPPIDIPVEHRESLLADPVDRLLVMSWSFGERIVASLRQHPELEGCAIQPIADLLR